MTTGKRNRIIAVWLLISLLQTETHSVWYKLDHSIYNRMVHPFAKAGVPFDVSLEWVVKQICDGIFLISVFSCMAWVIAKFSKRLKLIFITFAFYFLIDLLMLFYDNKISYGMYYSMILFSIWNIILILLPMKDEGDVHMVKEMFKN